MTIFTYPQNAGGGNWVWVVITPNYLPHGFSNKYIDNFHLTYHIPQYYKNVIMAPPRKYTCPKKLQKLVDAYFKQCDDNNDPYTVTGLALALDTSRHQLAEWSHQNDNPISPVIKRAKRKIVSRIEKMLVGGRTNVAGLIFWLKNIDNWADTKQVEHTGRIDHAHIVAKLDTRMNSALGIEVIEADEDD